MRTVILEIVFGVDHAVWVNLEVQWQCCDYELSVRRQSSTFHMSTSSQNLQKWFWWNMTGIEYSASFTKFVEPIHKKMTTMTSDQLKHFRLFIRLELHALGCYAQIFWDLDEHFPLQTFGWLTLVERRTSNLGSRVRARLWRTFSEVIYRLAPLYKLLYLRPDGL